MMSVFFSISIHFYFALREDLLALGQLILGCTEQNHQKSILKT